MLRRFAVLLPAVCLLLTGCIRLQAPAPEPGPPRAGEPALVSTPPPPDAASARLEPSCPAPDPEGTVSAAQLNRAFDRIDFPTWQSADLGATAMLSDGRVFWAWGDTGREKGYQPRLVDNSVFVTSGTCISQVVTDEETEFFPRSQRDLTHWPMSVVRLDPTEADGEGVRDKVVVYLSRIQRGDRQWDFLFRGTSVAVVTVGQDGVPRLERTVELTPDTAEFDQINWGAAAAPDGEWLHLYGTRYTNEAFITGRELYVSRVPLADPTNAEAQQFWDGTQWQVDQTKAAPVISAVDGTSQTLSVDRIGDRWVAISKAGGDLADYITMWTSDSPTGPWSEPVPVVYSPGGHDDDPDTVDQLTYTPLSHPDIPTASGALLISVSRNTTDIEELYDRPQSGRVLFHEVPLV
ncbi:DUF4185 domain-containing protein [Blastococcus sp. CCUG 61487]|uniref:DUF4185 domain-containing protein n=1 Tax=Blastococcus sp. CCUG 61487 TaxID=1840703 RepID=UPI001133C4BE|nr:DUF4185 domain-containing protein [Blastococcus sp. CCUG 61487]TKJ24806.1 hypothetical protein A6V29_04470 [Blastococcus sp. CCUG 61487]